MTSSTRILLAFLLLAATAVSMRGFAGQSFDHCPSCKKVEPVQPAVAGLCPNLMTWEDSKGYFKKWDDGLPSAKSMKKLNPHQQFTKFLAAFREGTKDFKTSLDAEDTDDLRATRSRLLSSVGWVPLQTWEQAKKAKYQDARLLGASQGLVCELVEGRVARGDCDGDLGLLNESERAVYIRRIEGAVVEYMSEGITVDEMIRGKVIPTEGARARLLVALMERHGLNHSLIFAAPKSQLKQSCEAKVAKPLRFTIFSVGKTEEAESVTLVNGTREGLLALQSFPALGEWVSFTAPVLSEPRVPATSEVQLPVCFLNAKQVHEFACNVWRTQK